MIVVRRKRSASELTIRASSTVFAKNAQPSAQRDSDIMSRPLFLGFITYSLLLAGVAAVSGELIALALPFVVYLLVGYLFAPDEIKLEATRHLSTERTSPHTDVVVTVTVTNRGSQLEEILLEDMVPADLTIRSASTTPGAGSPNRHLVRLAKNDSYTFAYTVSGPRGGYGFEYVRAKVNDPLKVTSREVQVEARGQLFVFPPVIRLQHVTIRPRRTRGTSRFRRRRAIVPSRSGGARRCSCRQATTPDC